LPFAFYGLTYLPLIVALMACAAWSRSRSELFAGPMRWYGIGVSGLLLALSLGHHKAVLPVGLVMTAVFAAQAVLFRNPLLPVPAAAAWVLAEFGLEDFLTTVLGAGVPAGFRLGCLTIAAATLLIAGRCADLWLTQLGPRWPWRLPGWLLA